MLRRALFLAVLFVTAAPLFAQATFDAQTSVADTYTLAAPTTTFAHTTTTAANRILLVSVHTNINVAPNATAATVTYGGQPLTLLRAQNDVTNMVRTEVWYLLTPPSGANNVNVTVAGILPAEHAEAVVAATTFSNAAQIAPTAASSEGSGNPIALAIAATSTNDVIVDFITGRENISLTPGAGQTPLFSRSTGNNPSSLLAESSGRLATTPTTTMTWSASHTRPWALVAVNIRSAVVDVAVAKTASNPGLDQAFATGDPLTYTVTVTNNGPATATNVVVTDPMPAGFAFTSVSPGANCAHAGGTVTCTFASMASGASNAITINGTVTASQTQLTNTASATRTQPDTNAANDSASVTVNVLAPTVVHMLEMSAVQDAKGKVVVSWTTSFEAENLGFNVYRQTSAGRVKINKQLIAGSALFAAKKELTSGRAYRWKDKVRAGELAQYYLEDIDLHGVRTLHGPVAPNLVSEVAEAANAGTLAEPASTGGIFVSPRGVGAARVQPGTATSAQRAQQFALAAQPAMKLMVAQEGWYRVSFASLIAAGFVPGKKLALFTEGTEQPIIVTNDAIEFYGFGLDTPASGVRAYWLTNDKGLGARIAKDKSKGRNASIARTPFTYERVERTVFFTALTDNGERENFFGAIVTNAGATQELFVENLDRTAATATLEATLQGGTDGRHTVRLALGNLYLGNVTFNDKQRLVTRFDVPVSALLDGANTLTLTALDGDLDVSVVESLRLTYPHRLVADNDALKLTMAGGTAATISGFTSARVRAIDVTNPAQPLELSVEVANGNATVNAAGQGTRSILVIGESRVLAPAQLIASRASTWSSTRNGADLLIITARAFTASAERLEARREREGLVTSIVDVEDLYDEFNFGHRGPGAIRAFLERTRQWSRAPKYVLLLGDASIDPRNYLGLGAFDYVPTKLVATYYMKTASDHWFVDGLGMSIGRLPARTVADAETMVSRIVNRDTRGNDAVSFVTDTDPEFDFAAEAVKLGNLVPSTYTKSFAKNATDATFESLLLTYIGHGSVDLWNGGWFTGNDASQLTNRKLPIVAAMTCLNGYFHDVYMSSLAEALLLNPNGGAVAVWTSSTLTEPVPQMHMAAEFYRQLFNGATVGEAATRAKSATTDSDVRNSWILFGDPSMKLR
ncbi:MAG TPA: C25 family cysteine peptidase [Thermoanaerobaculia bacterium]|nr:C25 family cysteine peptidase [Thermoanaerobaculia bacterium]